MLRADAGLQLLSETHTQQRDDWRENEWGMLASRPEWFKDCGQMTITCPRDAGSEYIGRHDGGFSMRQQGLQISLLAGIVPHRELDRDDECGLTFLFSIAYFATFGILLCFYLP